MTAAPAAQHTSTTATPAAADPPWIIDAAQLLAEPDPGPTPWLVQDLMVDQALIACVGRWKTTKSYAMLDLAISIVTGRPAFDHLEVPQPGPVVYVIEESGRQALWRRLDALARGRAIPRRDLQGLKLAANQRIKLDDKQWQQLVTKYAQEIRPRLIVFDPLARMKAAARDENAQTDMAAVIEYMRSLRDDTGAAVAFVHHTGHEGTRMRGSSDLESAWESRITWTREGTSPTVQIEAEHREAEPADQLEYRILWDGETRTMTFRAHIDTKLPSLIERITQHLREHTDQRSEDIARTLEVRRSDVDRALSQLEHDGTTHRGPSGRRDKLGRAIHDKVWNLSNQAGLWPVPLNGQDSSSHVPGASGLSEEGDRPFRGAPPDEPHGRPTSP